MNYISLALLVWSLTNSSVGLPSESAQDSARPSLGNGIASIERRVPPVELNGYRSAPTEMESYRELAQDWSRNRKQEKAVFKKPFEHLPRGLEFGRTEWEERIQKDLRRFKEQLRESQELEKE